MWSGGINKSLDEVVEAGLASDGGYRAVLGAYTGVFMIGTLLDGSTAGTGKSTGGGELLDGGWNENTLSGSSSWSSRMLVRCSSEGDIYGERKPGIAMAVSFERDTRFRRG